MSRSKASSVSPANSPANTTVAEYPELEQQVALICRKCDRQAKYDVGRVFIDPQWVLANKDQFAPDQTVPLEEAFSFSGLFRCEHCGGSGPWEFPPETSMQMMSLTLLGLSDGDPSQIQIGQMQTFDGAIVRTGAESEDYIKRKIEQHPDDAFLWGRLGNLYDNAGEIDLARPAYEKAIELDPAEIEANYSLGCYRMNEGDSLGAAECFQRISRHAKTASRRNPELLENLVRDSLGRLFTLHCESEGEIPFPLEFDPPPTSSEDGPQIINLIDFDLSTDEGWDIMTSICLTGKVPQRFCSDEASRLGEGDLVATGDRPSPPLAKSATIRGEQRVGRNTCCPCGSGKKFKRCCGRR